MNFASVASQLRESQDTPASWTAAGLAVQAGAHRARGALQALAGGVQSRANLITNRSVPSDGSRCEGCGEQFGMLRRRQICGPCDRYFCAACLGAFTVAGIGCFCGSRCPQCREMGQRSSEFESIRSKMEDGVGVVILFPPKATMFGLSTERHKLRAWLSLQSQDLAWSSLEQRGGQPVEQGHFSLAEIMCIRSLHGSQLEISMKGQPVTQLEFSTAEERANWEKHLNLAVDVLIPPDQREEREAAKATFRAQELEERRALNEERKKRLSEGLGMRYTAEAMMARSSGPTS
ncbi:unnamed protein product [Durusdinium trenchii]|uniref:Beta-D-xylosidase 6 n=2 Tax=Durusdinium trenchii TaxID=1381693 RepID=A0ABP0M2F7_9DINO